MLSASGFVLLVVAGTLVALAMLAWRTWQDSDPTVVMIDLPAASLPSPAPTPPQGEDGAAAEAVPESAEPVGGTAAADEDQIEGPPAGDLGDPAFFETPMRVIRRSNVRARPTPDSPAIGRAEEGSMVILVDPRPDRGYYRIATGEIEGWVWGANLGATNPSQQPDAEAATQTSGGPSAAASPATAD